jgi:hypothetical protein
MVSPPGGTLTYKEAESESVGSRTCSIEPAAAAGYKIENDLLFVAEQIGNHGFDI